jgi:hypothetical protein
MQKKLARSQIAFSALLFYITRLDLFYDKISITWNQPSTNKFIYLGKVFIKLINKSGRNYFQGHGEHLVWRYKDKHL